MGAASPSPPARADPETARRRRQGRVLFGLALTFLGLFLAAAELPTSGAALSRGIAILGAALLAVWVGGLLMGASAGRRRS